MTWMQESSSGENIFTRINTRKLRERAFEYIVQNFASISVRIKGGNSYKAKVLARSGKQLSAELEEGKFAQLGVVNIILSFDVGPEKYFMQTTSNITSERYIDISTLSDLFKLQRRQNFRVNLEQNYAASALVMEINDNKVNHDFPINDLSLGGLSFDISLDSPIAIEKGDTIRAQFHMEEKELTFQFSAVVCHVNRVGSMGSGVRRAGLEFQPLNTIIENKMLEVLIEIQRNGI